MVPTRKGECVAGVKDSAAVKGDKAADKEVSS